MITRLFYYLHDAAEIIGCSADDLLQSGIAGNFPIIAIPDKDWRFRIYGDSFKNEMMQSDVHPNGFRGAYVTVSHDFLTDITNHGEARLSEGRVGYSLTDLKSEQWINCYLDRTDPCDIERAFEVPEDIPIEFKTAKRFGGGEIPSISISRLGLATSVINQIQAEVPAIEKDIESGLQPTSSGLGVSNPGNTNDSQLHALIWRIYQSLVNDNEKPKAQKVWNEIQHRHNTYDTGEIIDEVTADYIFWHSAYRNKQQFKRTSFDSLLSRLRKNPPF